jgi:hypothetical protein
MCVTLFEAELNFLGLASAPSFYNSRPGNYIESQRPIGGSGVVETLYSRVTMARSRNDVFNGWAYVMSCSPAASHSVHSIAS